MGHEDKGHFAEKHTDRQIDETIAAKIRALSDNNCISCSAAHRAGKELNVTPSEIGVQTDLLEFQIIECQLGLYGFSDGEKKFNPNIEISPELETELDKKAVNNRISCLECWNIAKQFKMKRIDVGSACEKKSIKIKPCQLGAF